ncbi:MAG: serine protease [Sphingobacteriales bacterium]|nr:MAG: serine protease [Sphingobacteriales bacterium]
MDCRPTIFVLLTFFFLGSNAFVFADNPSGNISLSQSNPALNLFDYMQGVKFAELVTSPEVQKKIDTDGSVLLDHFAKYLKSLGFKTVAITSEDKKTLYESAPSYCDIVRVKVQMEVVKKQLFTNHVMEFNACTGDYFQFITTDTLYNDPYLLDKLYSIWRSFYDTTLVYEKAKRLKLPRNQTGWNEESLKKYFTGNKPDNNLEGIYEKFIIGVPNKSKYRIAVVKNPDSGNFDAIYLNGASNYEDWQVGEVAGYIYPTGTLNFYNVHWYSENKQMEEDVYLSVDQSNMLYLTFANEEETVYKYYKQFPRQGQQRRLVATGSGIAVSSNGYIVTNNHVIQGGNLIEVQTMSNGKKVVYQAVVMVNDEINDLAVIKIEDWNFSSLPEIPYTIKTNLSEVGEKVYTMGFPLSATMGESLKLTDGVISSPKGFKGDVSTYQLTVPVHPGNSGGPLYDYQGNLIGIIKAKHSQAESATYAIKTRNVLNLIELLPEKVVLPETNLLTGKELKEQVKLLEEFVFFIKVLE